LAGVIFSSYATNSGIAFLSWLFDALDCQYRQL